MAIERAEKIVVSVAIYRLSCFLSKYSDSNYISIFNLNFSTKMADDFKKVNMNILTMFQKIFYCQIP